MPLFSDDAPHLAGTVVTLIVFCCLTFAMRVYCRVSRHSWGVEDWLMTAAMLPFAVLSVACLVGSFNGIGAHAFRFKQPGNEKYTEQAYFWFFMFEVFYCVTIIPIKLSIGFMLVRIAQNQKAYIYGQYAIMAMFTFMNFIAALYIIFQCNPVSAAWDPVLMEEATHCQAPSILQNIYYATTAVNIFTDWATALMPIPLLWNVQLNTNAKLSVGAILGLGIFASLSACIRLKYTVNLTNMDDYLFGICNIVIWGYAENGVGLFVGNLSTLRPLFRRVLSLGGSDSASKPTGSGIPSGLPSKSQHPYRSVNNYELGKLNSMPEKESAPTTTTSTRVRGGTTGRPSFSSDDERQNAFGGVVSRGEMASSPGAILVSRQVEVSRQV